MSETNSMAAVKECSRRVRTAVMRIWFSSRARIHRNKENHNFHNPRIFHLEGEVSILTSQAVTIIGVLSSSLSEWLRYSIYLTYAPHIQSERPVGVDTVQYAGITDALLRPGTSPETVFWRTERRNVIRKETVNVTTSYSNALGGETKPAEVMIDTITV